MSDAEADLDLASEEEGHSLSLNLDDTEFNEDDINDQNDDIDDPDIDTLLNNQSFIQSNNQTDPEESDPEMYEIHNQSNNQFDETRFAQYSYGNNPMFQSNPRIVINQSESARTSLKLVSQLIKEKSDLDKYYAKSLKKIVERATINQPAQDPLAADPSNPVNQSTQFDLLLTSFRQLTATLASNFDILSSMVDEQVYQSINQFTVHHSKESKRVTDEINRLTKHMSQLNNELSQANNQSKKACADFQAWKNEYERHKQRELLKQSTKQSNDLFDVFASPFAWDFDSMKKKTLAIDNKYIQSIKAVRSFKPTYDQSITQLLNELQSLEEERRVNQLQSISEFLLIHGSMFDKACKNVRHVTALGSQVRPKREVVQFSQTYLSINQSNNHSSNNQLRNSANNQSTNQTNNQSIHQPLPVYIMHRGHPLYEETSTSEEIHSEDERSNDLSNDQSPDESSDESSSESESSSDDESDDDRNSIRQSNKPKINQPSKLPVHHRNHPAKKHALDELHKQKSDERIVAEKVLSVLINKLIGRIDQSVDQSIDDIERIVSDQTDHAIKSSTAPSGSVTIQLSERSIQSTSHSIPLSADEETAVKSIFATREGRLAFATVFASLSPSFNQPMNQAADQIVSPKMNASNIESNNQSMSLFFSMPEPETTLTQPLKSYSNQSVNLSSNQLTNLVRLVNLFLDASHSSYHCLPVVFVTQVAYQVTSINQSTDQSNNQTINQSVKQSGSPNNESIKRSNSQSLSLHTSVHSESDDTEQSKQVIDCLIDRLIAHPIFVDMKFWSESFFACLNAGFSHRTVNQINNPTDDLQSPTNQSTNQSSNQFNPTSLRLHPWYSDREVEIVNQSRKLFTFSMLARFSVLMRVCGVKRSLRRRFVDKKVRALDLLNQSINQTNNQTDQSINQPNYTSQLRLLRSLNDRPSLSTRNADDEEDDMPLAIDGLHEIDGEGLNDSDDEARQEMLRKKEEEKQIMKMERRKKRREEMKKQKAEQAVKSTSNNQVINQSINQASNQPVPEKRSIWSSWFGSKSSNQSTNQSASQSAAQSGRSSPTINQPIKPLVNPPVKQPIKPSFDAQQLSVGIRLPIAIAQPVRSPQTSPINPSFSQTTSPKNKNMVTSSIGNTTNTPIIEQTPDQLNDQSINQSNEQTTNQTTNQLSPTSTTTSLVEPVESLP